MFRNSIYTRRVERNRGCWQYIVTIDLDGKDTRDVVVTESIYNLLDELDNQDRHLEHQDERHLEYSELSDESLYKRSIIKPKPVDDAVLNSIIIDRTLAIIKTLPIIQARRFAYRNILGLTYAEIGRLEGCTQVAVKDSIVRATKKIRRQLKLRL